MIDDRKERECLTWCCRRHKPGAPVLDAHLQEDVKTLEGKTLKKGTVLMCLARKIHFCDDNFSRSKEFMPERWSEAYRASQGPGFNHDTSAFLPYG